MKKVLLITIILLGTLLSRGQLNVGIEIYCDGSPILDAVGLSDTDVSWSMKDLTQNPNCAVVNHEYAYVGQFDVNCYFMIIDLDWLNRHCISSWVKGDDIEISMTVTNVSHPLYGYSGTFVFKAPTIDTDFWNATGINLVRPSTFYHSHTIHEYRTMLEFCNRVYIGGKYERWRYHFRNFETIG